MLGGRFEEKKKKKNQPNILPAESCVAFQVIHQIRLVDIFYLSFPTADARAGMTLAAAATPAPPLVSRPPPPFDASELIDP